MRAAEEILLVEVAFPQKGRRRGDVQRLAAVRRAGQGDLFARQLVFVDRAVLQKRDGLERLGRGANAGDAGRIGEGQEVLFGP